MITRHDLVMKHAAEAAEKILESAAEEGGRPFFRIIEDHMHQLLGSDDMLKHHQARADEAMVRLPIKKRK